MLRAGCKQLFDPLNWGSSHRDGDFPNSQKRRTYSCCVLVGLAYQVLPVPVLDDNYSYVVMDNRSMSVAVVDPGDFVAVDKCLMDNDLQPDMILVTHKHWDHSGGVEELLKKYPQLKVYASRTDKVPGTTHFTSDDAEIAIGDLCARSYLTPGHTQGHVVYQILGSSGDCDSLFTGDLLFLGGCGKVFEGTSEQLLRSLDLVSSLDEHSHIWPGHEYAQDNLNFAAFLEPENTHVKKRLKKIYEQRSDRQPTCPSTLGEEKLYNPFLRTGDPEFLVKIFAKPLVACTEPELSLWTSTEGTSGSTGADLYF